MRRSTRFAYGSLLALLGSILTWTPKTWANIESAPFPYDARAMALGNTGVAYTFNGASVYQNPAALDGIDKMAFTLALGTVMPRSEAPLNGPSTPAVASTRTPSPLFLAGGGYRLPVLEDRVTVGLAAYPTAGAGGTYEKVASLGGRDLKAAVFALEISPALSVAILRKQSNNPDGGTSSAPLLSVGFGYRISYLSLTAPVLQPLPADVSVSGLNFAALSAGLYFEPIHSVGLGFTYRSKVSADLSGTSSAIGVPNLQGLDTKTTFITPHELRFGSAFRFFDDRLMFTLDFKYLFYNEFKTADATITLPTGAKVTQSVPYDWHNVGVVGVGVEAFVHPMVPVRIGFNESGSATSASYPSPFFPPPSPLHTITLGTGLKLESFDLDLGGAYGFSSTNVENPSPPSTPGRYAFTAFLVGGSVTYHL